MDQSVFRFQVLKRYKRDFAANSPEKHAASHAEGLSQEFIATLTRAFEEDVTFRYSEFNVFPTEVIIDYVRRTHQLYLHKTLHEIEQSIGLLNQAYEQGHQLLEILNSFYLTYKTDLVGHIVKEDQYLLPHIEFLEQANISGFSQIEFYNRSSAFNIGHFFELHEENDTALEIVRDQILSYEPPHVNRFIYGVLISQLELFEQDLRVHGMIEEQVLIPRALELERKMNKRFEKQFRLN